MNVTEVRIKLLPPSNGRLLAYASITLDQTFVVRDVKVLQGDERLFVAMPSRKLNVRCPVCGTRNQVGGKDRLCLRCDKPLPEPRGVEGEENEVRSPYVDVFHPVNALGRHLIDAAVLHAYQEEVDKSLVRNGT